MDRQNASALSTQASIALRGTPSHAEPEHHLPRSQSLLLPLANLPRFGHLAGGDDLRERVEAIVYQARAQRAADLGEVIGVGVVAISRGLARMIHFAGRSVRALPAPRVRRLLSKK